MPRSTGIHSVLPLSVANLHLIKGFRGLKNRSSQRNSLPEGTVYGVVGAPTARAHAAHFRRKRVTGMTSKGMMMVRSAVLVCGLGVAVVGTAFAQDQAPPPPPAGTAMQGPPRGGRGGMMDPGRRADMLKQNLSLSDDQTSQVKTIFEDSRTKMEALRSN